MVRLFWVLTLLVCFAACGALVLSCGGEPLVVTTSAIHCHQRTLAAVNAAPTCNDALIAVERIITTDPDCIAVYQGRTTGLSCIDHDGGADGR